MNAKSYILRHNLLLPFFNEYTDDGLDTETFYLTTNGLIPKERDVPYENRSLPTELGNLYLNHKFGHIAFNWTFYMDEPINIGFGWMIGRCDGDTILVLSNEGSVGVYDDDPFEPVDFEVGKVAKSLEHYFDANIFCAVFSNQHNIKRVNSDFFKPDYVLNLVASVCAELAGGKEYLGFWSGILGADEGLTSA
jgi:hypothetical protein